MRPELSTNYLAYLICKLYLGLAEVPGANDNPYIETAHKFCKIEDMGQHPSTDEIPWCSAWVNCMVFFAMSLKNYDEASAYFSLRFPQQPRQGALDKALGVMWKAAGKEWVMGYGFAQHGNEATTAPTGDARAKSWLEWGRSVQTSDAKQGDIVVLSRVGGYHVCFLDDDFIDVTKETFRALGGNQGNKVCVANEKTANILSVRRADEG